MGQAKRRKDVLGDAYGTPEGSNQKLVAYRGSDQSELDRKALNRILAAKAAGMPVTLVGTKAARPLAQAAGLPWLHELPAGRVAPRQLAWDPSITTSVGGCMLDATEIHRGGLLIIGAGASEWVQETVSLISQEVMIKGRTG
jgi:hypothetical protein